jgi:hypothetical protein
MFGRNPERYLPHATISFAAFKGTNLDAESTLKREITGTIDNQIYGDCNDRTFLS